VRGDDYDFDLLVSDVPTGQTIVSGWLTVKRLEDDDTALIEKNVGTTITSAGAISVSGIYTRVLITADYISTGLLRADTEYYYDIQVITSANRRKTIEKGTIQPLEQITRI
jgi:hypothetical protein